MRISQLMSASKNDSPFSKYMSEFMEGRHAFVQFSLILTISCFSVLPTDSHLVERALLNLFQTS